MEQITVKARAKLNPYLKVLYKRPDGYHELFSVMQSLALHDTILIKKINKYPFRFICEPDRLPCDERNLAYRAVVYMLKEYGIKQGIFVKLTKRIPISAGLGGGSSDCAAALTGMNRLFNLNIPQDKLVGIAGTFGADVPFCITGGTVLAEGVGERCVSLPAHPRTWVVLARPPVSVSTASVFGHWARTEESAGDGGAFLKALSGGNVYGMAKCFYNSLLPVTADMHPMVNEVMSTLTQNGALGASMSGSGPTVFGYFLSKDTALAAINSVKKEHPSIHEIFLTKTFNPSTKGRLR